MLVSVECSNVFGVSVYIHGVLFKRHTPIICNSKAVSSDVDITGMGTPCSVTCCLGLYYLLHRVISIAGHFCIAILLQIITILLH